MFTPWILEQQYRDDSVGKLATLMWQDYNAGCAGHILTPVGWKEHFEQRHPKKFGELLEWLGDAYVEYATGLNKHKTSL